MPELMKSLKGFPGITSFTLFTRNVERPVPAELWNLIRDQRVQFNTGEGTLPIDRINSLTLEPLCIQTKPFLQLRVKADLYPFKPTAEDTHLRRIEVLQMKVKVSVHGLCEYKMHIPSTPEAIIVRELREGWTPVHLEGQTQDDEEQRDMNNHYRWKTYMQFGM
ncbi:hypothetical protein DFH11DRAFT_1604097 [Phellopilus nigrolimitatus]|nr:hypothetical protein DFH11DRAFT_1604097 [Phellopilus nigrolimitatus]